MFKYSTILLAALAGLSVSAVPVEENSNSSGLVQLSGTAAAAALLGAQAAYALGGGDKKTTSYVANNQTGVVSGETILKYSRYAGAAYKVKDTTWTCDINCQAPETKSTVVDYHWDLSSKLDPSFGYVAHKDDTKEIIASWRGSTVFMDFVKDLTFVPVSWPASIPGSKVHLGFLQAYSAAASSIEAEISKLVAKYPDYSIVITGHSLGSAQATLATVDLATRHPEWIGKIKLFTYGEPRVGNPAFAAWLSKQSFPIYRVVYKGDMAPRLPFRFMGFEHHSQEVWYDKSGVLRFQGSNGESPYGENSLTPLQWDLFDHYRYPGLDVSLF